MGCRKAIQNSSSNTMQAAKIKVCSINICGMSGRSQFTLDKYCYDNSIDILAVQETNCSETSNLELKSREYISDTNKSVNKGVLLYVDSSKYCITQLKAISEISKNIDTAWGLVSGNGQRFIVGSVYLKLNYKNAVPDLIKMLKAAKNLSGQLKAKGVFALGDFNSRHRLWGDKVENDYGKQLVNLLSFQDYSILNSENPSFLSVNGSSYIDFVISCTELEHLFSHVSTDPEVELFSGAPLRGHVPVQTSLVPPSPSTETSPKKKLDISNMDWPKWSKYIDEVLSETQDGLVHKSACDMWLDIDKIIYESTKKFARYKMSTIHSKPYWTQELTNASKALREASKIYSKRNTLFNKEALNTAKDNFNNIRESECQKFILEKTKKLNAAQSTKFWKEFKRMFAKKADKKVEPLSDPISNDIKTDPKEIEDLLFSSFFEGRHLQEKGQDFDDKFFQAVNEIYDSILNEENNKIRLESDLENTQPSFQSDVTDMNSAITIEEFSYFVKNYNSSGKGFDNHSFHPEMLKHLGPVTQHCILVLFNSCLSTGIWAWDLADIIFLKKDGKKDFSKTGSYRPISITSYIGKVFEQIIALRLDSFFKSIGLLDKFQEGFKRQRNTIRYLHRLDNDIREKLSRKHTVICLFIDFEKAFDSVWKKGIMKKLYDIGINGNIWLLINSFLMNRKVKLLFNDYTGIIRFSKDFGLPQGSALSPILFRFYLHDLGEEIVLEYDDDISIFKFADDGTLRVTGSTTAKCLDNLKVACNSVNSWSNKWRMVVNCDSLKTELICFGTAEGSTALIPGSFQLGSNAIPFVEKTKVLGLTMDRKLTYVEHGKDINKKCLGRWAMLCKYTNRNWGFKQSVIVRLVEVIIATSIQYAGIVWINNSSIRKIEQVWYKMLKSSLGAVFNVKLETAEAILGVLPIHISNRLNSIKHFLKLNINNEEISHSDPLKEFLSSHLRQNNYSLTTKRVKEVFQFLSWKIKNHPKGFTSQDTHIIDTWDLQRFTNLSPKCCSYSKVIMKTYAELMWQSTINSQFQAEGFSKAPIVSTVKLKFCLNTSRKFETLMLSMFYPNNLLNAFLHRYNPQKFNTPLCNCSNEEQNAYHILFNCHLVDKYYRTELQQWLLTQPEHHSSLLTYIDFISFSRNTVFHQCCQAIIKDAIKFLKCEIIL